MLTVLTTTSLAPLSCLGGASGSRIGELDRSSTFDSEDFIMPSSKLSWPLRLNITSFSSGSNFILATSFNFTKVPSSYCFTTIFLKSSSVSREVLILILKFLASSTIEPTG